MHWPFPICVQKSEVGGDNEGKRGKGCQGTCVKDPGTKPKAGRIEGGRWGWLESGSGGGGEMETTVLEQQ